MPGSIYGTLWNWCLTRLQAGRSDRALQIPPSACTFPILQTSKSFRHCDAIPRTVTSTPRRLLCVPEAGDRLDEPTGIDDEHVRASRPLLSIAAKRNPVREHGTLAVANVSMA